MKEEKIWIVPVFWEMQGEVYLKAVTAEEALNKFLNNAQKIKLPADGKCVPSSFGSELKDIKEYKDVTLSPNYYKDL